VVVCFTRKLLTPLLRMHLLLLLLLLSIPDHLPHTCCVRALSLESEPFATESKLRIHDTKPCGGCGGLIVDG